MVISLLIKLTLLNQSLSLQLVTGSILLVTTLALMATIGLLYSTAMILLPIPGSYISILVKSPFSMLSALVNHVVDQLEQFSPLTRMVIFKAQAFLNKSKSPSSFELRLFTTLYNIKILNPRCSSCCSSPLISFALPTKYL